MVTAPSESHGAPSAKPSARRRLVGVVDVELYTDELVGLADGDRDEPAGAARDEVFQLIGVHLTAAQQAKPVTAFRGRFPWLLCNLGGGLLAAVLSGIYHDVLTWRDAALAVFMRPHP